MQRKPMVAGNWKMNKTAGEGAILVQNLEVVAEDTASVVETVVAPPFTALHSVSNVIELDKSTIKLSAQDMFWEPDGAFTGAISARMLEDLHVDYVIVGHSERRQFFCETNEIINRKVKAVFEHDMTAILCCGETLETREKGSTTEWIRKQIKEGVQGLDAAHAAKLVIAYEPIWAIGTGRTATPDMAQEVCRSIREVIIEEFGQDIAEKTRILYGGSVKPENAALFFNESDIDGALVGGAALEANSFAAIIKAAVK